MVTRTILWRRACWGVLALAQVASAQLPVTAALQGATGNRGASKCSTALEWHPLEEARKLAKEQKKLLMVMHLSGNFYKQEFT